MSKLYKAGRARIRRFLDKDLRAVVANTSWMSVATIGKLVLGFVQVAVVTRLLGKHAYGELGLAMSITNFTNLVLSVRVWEWVTKYLADAAARSDAVEAAAVVKVGYGLSAIVNCVTVGVVATASPWISRDFLHQPQIGTLASMFSLTLLGSWVGDTSLATLRLFGQFKWLAAYGIATTVIRLLFLTIPLLLNLGLVGVVTGYVAVELLCGGWILWHTSAAFRVAYSLDWWRAPVRSLAPKRREIGRMLAYSYWIDTLKSFGAQADVLILGHYRSPAEVGYYKAAMNFIDAVTRLAASLLQVLFPSLATLAARRDADGMLRLMRRISLVVLCGVIPACLMLDLAAPAIVHFTYGPGFGPSVGLLQILSWSLLWTSTIWVVAASMSIGKARWAFQMTALLALFKLAVVLVLAPRLGAKGVAISALAHSVAFVVLSLIYFGRIRRHVRSPAFAQAAPPGL